MCVTGSPTCVPELSTEGHDGYEATCSKDNDTAQNSGGSAEGHTTWVKEGVARLQRENCNAIRQAELVKCG